MAQRTAEQHIAAPVAFCAWRSMLFAHWRVEPDRLQRLLPPGLEVDTHDGSAWVSLTPFEMADVRPGLPGLGRTRRGWTTLETNLRTYVRRPGGADGLWFLSLDIVNPLAVGVARMGVGAPYFRADLDLRREGDTVSYSGRRGSDGPGYDATAQLGPHVEPDPTAVWLTSRWRAFTRHLGQVLVVPVEHEPWPVREVRLELSETVTVAAGLDGLGPPDLAHWSEGVHVRVGFPRPSA